MKTGELCESCGRFSEGRHNVVRCPICDNDVCNLCGNMQACPQCFDYYNYLTGDIIIEGKTYRYILEKGEEIGTWELNNSNRIMVEQE